MTSHDFSVDIFAALQKRTVELHLLDQALRAQLEEVMREPAPDQAAFRTRSDVLHGTAVNRLALQTVSPVVLPPD